MGIARHKTFVIRKWKIMLSRQSSDKKKAVSICYAVAFIASVREIQRRGLSAFTWPQKYC